MHFFLETFSQKLLYLLLSLHKLDYLNIILQIIPDLQLELNILNLNEILLNLPSHMAKSSFVTHTPVLNIPLLSRLYMILYLTNLILQSHSFTFTFSLPITPSDTKNYLPSHDPNITHLMVSHYDCAKQHNFRQFTLLNVKQCTEAPSDIKHASVKARVFVRANAKGIKAFNASLMPKKKERFVSKVQLIIVVLIEPYGTTIHYHFLLRSILQSVKKTLFDILMVQITKY